MTRHVTVTLTEAQAIEILVALDYFRDSTDLWPSKYRVVNNAERVIEAARDRSGRRRRPATLPGHGEEAGPLPDVLVEG